jgi:hypothetical protein
VVLQAGAHDPREPGRGDFLDCPSAASPCEAVLFARVEPDEKSELPKGRSRDAFRFLTLKGFRSQGGDPITTVAVEKTASGHLLFVDFNNDEDLGNDGPGLPWAAGDSCVTAKGGAGRAAGLAFCRGGDRAGAWRARCESMKAGITWADCEEGPYRVRFDDIAHGAFAAGKGSRRIGLADMDGDGRFRLQGGDRLLIDWDGDGRLSKSLDGDAFTPPPDGPFTFSLDGGTWELASAEEDGSALTLRRLPAFQPEAALFKAVEGKPAPDIRFVNMDGDTVRLSDSRGRKVLLHFWSVLCKPCLDQLPDIRRVHAQFKDRGWEVVSLTTEQDLSLVQQATLKHHMEWSVGMAGPEARGYYQNHPLPLILKIDAKGVVEKRDMKLGGRSF